MELTGEKIIDAPQERVYDALRDPFILRQAIPGVQTMTKQGDGRYLITAALGVGPLRPTFTGTVEVYNEDRPAGYSVRGAASAGPAGAVGGNAHVALAAVDHHTTNLAYHVTADPTGEVAAMDRVRIDVIARTLIAEFFMRLQSIIDGDAANARPDQSAGPYTGARPMPYQPPRYPPQSNYPDFDAIGDAALPRSEAASITDATGGLVRGEPAAGHGHADAEAPLSARHPGNLPQTPYRSTDRLGHEAADTAVYDGSGSGVGRWFMAAAGVALIALLLNGGFSTVPF